MESIVYPYIPDGRVILYVDESNPFMKMAKEVSKEESTDLFQSTGSVLVKRGEVISKGANQSAIKNKKLLKFHQEKFCVRKWLRVKTGTHYWLCPGCASSSHHSEIRAIKDARKKGHDTSGADLYLWGHWWCCRPCWNAIIEGGINNVYLLLGSEELFNKSRANNILGRR